MAKRRSDGRYEIVVEGGRRFTGMDLIDWVVRAEQLGAGEILLTSMDADGTKEGFDLPMLRAVTEAVRIPVIASLMVADTLGHFVQVFGANGCRCGIGCVPVPFRCTDRGAGQRISA